MFYGHDQYYELNSIDGEPVVFEWKIFPGHTTLELVQEIQKFMNEELKTTPHDFKHKTICMYTYMSMYNDIEWTRKDNREVCLNNSSNVAEYAKSFFKGHWSVLGPGCEKKWCTAVAHKTNRLWDKTAKTMLGSFKASGHP